MFGGGFSESPSDLSSVKTIVVELDGTQVYQKSLSKVASPLLQRRVWGVELFWVHIAAGRTAWQLPMCTYRRGRVVSIRVI